MPTAAPTAAPTGPTPENPPAERGERSPPPDGGVPLLRVGGLTCYFPQRGGVLQTVTDHVKAVDGVSFDLARGETLGLVGESGSGKTTVGRTILRLITPVHGVRIGGTVTFDGQDVLAARGAADRALRRDMQIIFQDPAGSLNPRMRVWEIVSEPLLVHGLARGKDRLLTQARELLERCGMSRAAAERYPHEFSGGQRQRIGIARALALNPRFIVCDEPTSALDVSIQAQIINLLTDLQRDMGLSYLFISHDMAVVQHVCKRIAVMRQGRIAEAGDRDQILTDPQHPYTQQLLAAVPVPRPRRSA